VARVPVVVRAAVYMAVVGGAWLVALPAGLLDLEHGRLVAGLRDAPFLAVAAVLLAAGLALALSGGYLLVSRGRGTPLPLDPPRALVVAGTYRHVRNPPAVGMLLLSGAEAVALDAALPALLPVLTLAYLQATARWEERQLVAAFGEAYLRYRRHVRRWVPRRRPYLDPAGQGADPGEALRP